MHQPQRAASGGGANPPAPPPGGGGAPGAPTRGVAAAPSAPGTGADGAAAVETTVVRVIDGDTVAVRPVTGALRADTEHAGAPEVTVRILGIDAPEMNYHKGLAPECGAQAATDHLGGILAQGLPVVLDFDPAADHTDRYGRTLAYVETSAHVDAGLQQISDGYAMPWYPKSAREPERVPPYRAAAAAAVAAHAGAHSWCASIGRG
jgi:micrococcal nuclease